MRWPEILAPEWKDFDNIISEMTDKGRLLKDRFLFRGQADKTWELVPSLYRIFKQYLGYFLPAHSAVEWQIAEKFKAIAGQYIPENLIPDDEDLVGWWHLMRERKRTKWVNINGIGLLPDYQGLGGNAILYTELQKTVRAYGFEHMDVVQVDEKNLKSYRDMVALGVK